MEELGLGRLWRTHHLKLQLLTTERKDWIISFVNQSPAVLDNTTKNRATKYVFVSDMGDGRKLKVWCPPRPPFCLFSFSFICLLSPSALLCSASHTSLLLHIAHLPSHSLTLGWHLDSPVFAENRCERRKLLAVQLLRNFPTRPGFSANCSETASVA